MNVGYAAIRVARVTIATGLLAFAIADLSIAIDEDRAAFDHATDLTGDDARLDDNIAHRDDHLHISNWHSRIVTDHTSRATG